MLLTSLRRILTAAAVLALVLAGAPAQAHHQRPLIGSLSIDIDRKGVDYTLLEVIYKLMARGNVDAVLAFLDRDVEWKVEGVEGTVPFAGTFTGREGVRDYFEALSSSAIIDELSLRYVVAQGDTVHLHFFESGVALTTGKSFQMEIVQTWFFDHGRVVKFREFNDTFAMFAAFDTSWAPAYSMVANDADDGIVPSSFADPISVASTQYAAIKNGDLPSFLGTISDDIIWILAGPKDITPIAGTYYGLPGIYDFLNRLYSTEAYVDFGPNYMISDGSRVDSQFFEIVYVYRTGRTFTCQGIHSANLNDAGKINSFRSYNDTYSVAMGHKFP